MRKTPLIAVFAVPVSWTRALTVAAAPWEYPLRMKHSLGFVWRVVVMWLMMSVVPAKESWFSPAGYTVL
jgi:hypothetical protein